ncbi:delta(24(24(1)))-sterol reductase [Polychaeton citri CBS 116435]|uniref:Delta(24(24(1)))-sterol reductase n=1 Tax=Polychaeton citri CBS 116435 TaxID=1314669 RepID=A0A9P4UU09_9PEZI|nr:delta(24(24(1)))-sterol reductase [Polychaeton citri CBS 116435]
MTVTRSQSGKTPRKPIPEGFVETPGARRRTTRKSTTSNSRSASPAPNGAPTETAHSIATDPAVKVSEEEQIKAANDVLANGKPKARVIDGWLEGSDPKIDLNPHFDFGGTPGVTAMMIGFPLLMWYMWIGATYYDGKFPHRESSDQSWVDFGKQMVWLAYTGAFPHAKAWAMYWVFLAVQVLFYMTLPGVYSKGKPLPHEGGKQLLYFNNSVWSFYTNIVLALTLHFTGVFKLYTLIDEFGPLMSVAIISGFLVSIAVFISAHVRGKTHRMTGHIIYDFFMGAELNPRLFGLLDFKMFLEVRMPWYILFFMSLSAAARQYEQYGYVSGEIGFILMAHYLYANACSKGEEMICITWDMYYEKLGFMLVFWNMAGVPLSYCHCTIFLANHDPATYAWPKYLLVPLYASYLFAYWVWDTGNSQKNMFRASEKGYQQHRKTFPQLPWKFVDNPQYIKTETGDSLLVDGWYKYARKIHYTADTWFAICWGLITGFHSPFPWFYPIFFCVMITHRAWRDIQRCKEKYGTAWEEYEKRVPYLFIPYVF